MVGLFDSGTGGLNTVRYVKEISDEIDLVYLIDRKRAPYGIKSEKEITAIAEDNIKELRDRGAERVLIACCTASTVHHLLKDEYRKISIPIIEAVAKTAKKATRSGRIGVIATDRTVSSHAFLRALTGLYVRELSCRELVGMIDGGITDKTVMRADIDRIRNMLLPVLTSDTDTLILGCTHFPALKSTIEEIASHYGIKNVIDSAHVGAELLISESKNKDK